MKTKDKKQLVELLKQYRRSLNQSKMTPKEFATKIVTFHGKGHAMRAWSFAWAFMFKEYPEYDNRRFKKQTIKYLNSILKRIRRHMSQKIVDVDIRRIHNDPRKYQDEFLTYL